MEKKYDMGSDDRKISIRVNVGTPASVTTSVNLLMDGIDDKIIAESDVDSGNIPETFVSTAGKLRNATLFVYTSVNGNNIDDTAWESVKSTIIVEYRVSGGSDGVETFRNDKDDMECSSGGKNIDIKKFITLS